MSPCDASTPVRSVLIACDNRWRVQRATFFAKNAYIQIYVRIRSNHRIFCVFSNVHYLQVTQKKDIKRQKDRLEALKKEAEEERARARQAARERVVKDFERGQSKLASGIKTMENGEWAGRFVRKILYNGYLFSYRNET